MIYISGELVRELLDMKSCIKLMNDTFFALAKKECTQILRTALSLEERNILGVMPSSISSKKIAGAKILTVCPDNFNKGLPSHQGLVVVFETETGSLKAVVEGDAITEIRTAAVSAVATELLSRKDSKVLAILGSGLQARKHLEAIKLVRQIEYVTVWDINLDSAKKYSAEMSERFGIPVRVCKTTEEAVKDADIICTVTAAKEPILMGRHVKKGAHINAVGACNRNYRELDSELIKNSKFFSDSIESTINESGDFLIPLEEGVINKDHILGEIGDIILGKINGRKNYDDITIFEALGLAVEDLAAADFVINRALNLM